jgi:hypothetical protein
MTVRDYLVGQGINMNSVTSQGFGQNSPVASNSTASGRQQNRRVQMVVSGEPIGDVASAQAMPPSGSAEPQYQNQQFQNQPAASQPNQPQTQPSQMPQQQQPTIPR